MSEAELPMPLEQEAPLLRQIAPECAVFAVALAAYGLRAVLWWYPWEDQAAHQYMAWGIFHGMRPYVDAIDMNWPGIVLLHVVAYQLAGLSSWGIRGLDLLFQFGLVAATAYLLAAWCIARPMRLLVGCGYLMSYLATGWWWTAQREGFNWPLCVIGTLPLTVLLGPSHAVRRRFGVHVWFACGLICGLSLWIKPTPALSLIAVSLLALALRPRRERAEIVRGIVLLCLGIATVSIAFIITLAAMGSLRGFVHWGIFYVIRAYGKMQLPWSLRLVRTFRTAVSPSYRPVTLVLALIGLVALAVMPKARAKVIALWRRPWIAAVAMVLVTTITAMLQGKSALVYQYVPMRWSFALAAAVIWGALPWNRWLQRGTYLASFLIIAATFASLTPMGPTPGTRASRTIARMLKPDDQVIMWGASTTLLTGLEHRTPFAIVGSAAVYWFTPPASKYRHDILDLMARALRDPSVKFLFIEQGDLYSTEPVPEKLWDILERDAAIAQILAQQYRPLQPTTVQGFDVWEHDVRSGQHSAEQ